MGDVTPESHRDASTVSHGTDTTRHDTTHPPLTSGDYIWPPRDGEPTYVLLDFPVWIASGERQPFLPQRWTSE